MRDPEAGISSVPCTKLQGSFAIGFFDVRKLEFKALWSFRRPALQLVLGKGEDGRTRQRSLGRKNMEVLVRTINTVSPFLLLR